MTAARDENPFSGAYLERRAEDRSEPDWLARALDSPGTRFILGCGTRHLVQRAPEVAIACLAASHPLVRASTPGQLVLLGWYRGERCILVDMPDEPGQLPPDTDLAELRPLLAQLPADQAAVLAAARALLIWRARHRYCGSCGAPTAAQGGGHTLKCTGVDCGAEIFPRIDPAVIVLVSDGEHVLLGRQATWPSGRYSALAGFVEPGETLEDTVRREVLEETGIRVEQVSYFASQPWPFPASLMLGFHAAARRAPVVLDGELEEARWYSAAEIAAAGSALLPPPHTIARRLIDSWHARTAGEPWPRA